MKLGATTFLVGSIFGGKPVEVPVTVKRVNIVREQTYFTESLSSLPIHSSQAKNLEEKIPKLDIEEVLDKNSNEIIDLLISKYAESLMDNEILSQHSRAIEFLFRLAESDCKLEDFDTLAKGDNYLNHGGMGSTDSYWESHYHPSEMPDLKHCHELYNLFHSLRIDEEIAIFIIRSISGKEHFKSDIRVGLKIFQPEVGDSSADVALVESLAAMSNLARSKALVEDELYRFLGIKRTKSGEITLHRGNDSKISSDKIEYLADFIVRLAMAPVSSNYHADSEKINLQTDFKAFQKYREFKDDVKVVVEKFIGKLSGLHQNNFINRLHVAEFLSRDLAGPDFIDNLSDLSASGVKGTLDLFNKAYKLSKTQPRNLYGLFYEATTTKKLIASLDLNPCDVILSEYRVLSRRGKKHTDIDISLRKNNKRFDIELKSTVIGISDHDLDEILYMASHVDNPVLLPENIDRILDVASGRINLEIELHRDAMIAINKLNNLIDKSSNRLRIWNTNGEDVTNRVVKLKGKAENVLKVAA